MSLRPQIDEIAEDLREVAVEVVLPRFRTLVAGEIEEKGPGDLVTIADVEAEQALTARLLDRWPGAAVIGEEAVAADPGLLRAARTLERVWVIDPIDGTSNFVAGSPDFAVMVSLVERGVTTASWIHQPVADRTYVAELGSGAAVDGRPLVRVPAPPALGDLHGAILTRYLEPGMAGRVAERTAAVGRIGSNPGAAGVQYPKMVEGDVDFTLYWRTLVWDHAPGALLVQEAGGRATRLDGSPYEPWGEQKGLLVSADAHTHEQVLRLLAPDGAL